MTGAPIPEQPERRSSDPRVRLAEIDARLEQLHREELAWQRARADRLSGEVRAAIFTLAVLRVSAPTAFVAAVDMAATEPGIEVPDWLRRMPDECLDCDRQHAGPCEGAKS